MDDLIVCTRISSTFEENINGTFKKIILPIKGMLSYSSTSETKCVINLKFLDQDNRISLKYEVRINILE